MFHIVLLTLLLGLGTHLIGYILPRGMSGKEKGNLLLTTHSGKNMVCSFQILSPIHVMSGI